MAFRNVEVKITVKVDGERVGRRKVSAKQVGSLEDGAQVLLRSQQAVTDLADELRAKVGV